MDRVTAGGGVRWGGGGGGGGRKGARCEMGGREGAVSAVEIVRSDQQ